jgi:hypothetical protein
MDTIDFLSSFTNSKIYRTRDDDKITLMMDTIDFLNESAVYRTRDGMGNKYEIWSPHSGNDVDVHISCCNAEDGGSMLFRNVNTNLQVYTALQPSFINKECPT